MPDALDLLLEQPQQKQSALDSLLGQKPKTYKVFSPAHNKQIEVTEEEYLGRKRPKDITGAGGIPVISDVLGGVAKGVTAGYYDPSGEPTSKVAEKVGEFIGFVAPIGGVSKGLKLIKGFSKLPSFLRSAMVGGAYGGVEKLEPEEDRLRHVVTTATVFGGLDAGLGAVGRYIAKRRVDKLAQAVTEEVAPTSEPVAKIIQVLKEAKPVRKKQEVLYTKERVKRVAKAHEVAEKTGGEAGFYAELGQFKGELPKAQFEGIKEKLTSEDVTALFDQIKHSPHITYFESITGRKALAKLFGEFGGGVPTEGELEILGKIFPKEFVEAVKGEGRTILQHLGETTLQIANIPRTVMASFDLSFGLRQGIFAAPRYRREFYQSFKKQFGAFASEQSYKAILEDITRRPTFNLMRGRIAFTDIGQKMGFREERFMSSWGEKIPIIGKGIHASARAYTGFANKFRADLFDRLFKQAQELGQNPAENQQLLDGIAKFVNSATGRGSIGDFERSAQILNAFFFSPRLIASRLTLLNPVYYLRQPPLVRKEALKSLFTFVGAGMTLGVAAKLGGADVGADPRSSDFGKIKIGNTRIDPWGGFQQYARMAGQLISGEYISSVTGRKITLGEGYKPVTRLDILQRQVEAKEAPVASLITTLLRGQDFQGKPISVPKEIASRFVPMVAADIYELANENPELLPLGALGVFGVGIQTYKKR